MDHRDEPGDDAECVVDDAPMRAAVTAGFFDRVVPASELEHAAEEAARALSTLNMAAHAATKMRARGAVISLIRSMIDEDITPQYGENRVASRASA